MGFEIAHDGVYVSQSGSLVFLRDTDGDDKYDAKVLLSGFDGHYTPRDRGVLRGRIRRDSHG